MTSHDVVNRVRRVGERRVGHAGTLDPAASGVLVVGIGQATRLLGLLTLEAQGLPGPPSRLGPRPRPTTRRAPSPARMVLRSASPTSSPRVPLLRARGAFRPGSPTYSAISVNGKRAYAAAREELELRLPRAT